MIGLGEILLHSHFPILVYLDVIRVTNFPSRNFNLLAVGTVWFDLRFPAIQFLGLNDLKTKDEMFSFIPCCDEAHVRIDQIIRS